jgi:hypothetical protein
MFARPHLTDAPSLTVLSPEDGGEGAGGGGGGGQIPAPQPAADVTAMQARLAEYEKREAARAAADAAAEKKRLESEGNLQGLLEAERAEKAKLAADAEIGREYRARETKRIEEARAKLTPKQAEIVNGALARGDLRLAADLLDELGANAASGSFVARAGAPGGTPPPAAAKADIRKLLGEGVSLDKIKAAHPEEFAEYSNGFIPAQRLTSYAQQQAARSAAPNGKKG